MKNRKKVKKITDDFKGRNENLNIPHDEIYHEAFDNCVQALTFLCLW